MQKILITISNGSIARNLLRASLLDFLLRDNNVAIYLLVPHDKVDLYTQEFGSSRVAIEGLPAKTLPTFFDRVMMYLCRNCFFTETLAALQYTRLLVDRNIFSFVLKRIFIYTVGRLSLAHWFIRKLAALRRPAEPIEKIFQKISPDVLFATDMQNEIDLHALIVAKRYGVKRIGMVRSWDNLTNNLVQIVPDLLMVWSPYIYKKAISLQHISKDIVSIVGIPQYDYFLKKGFLKTRKDFLSSMGLSENSKLILFAAIGHYFAPYEWDIPQIINDAIESGELPRECVVVARPHPSAGIPHGMEPRGARLIIDTPAHYSSASAASAEMLQSDIDHFGNLMFHADVVVTGASTIAIDAAIFDRPIVHYAFDGTHTVPYHQSARSAYAYSHYKALLGAKGAEMAYTKDDLIEWIQKYLNDPTIHREGRKRIVDEFVYFRDGGSTQRIASLLLRELA